VKAAAIFLLASLLAANLWAASPVKILPKVDSLPVALSDDFQFRKTKLFYLNENPPKAKKSWSSPSTVAGKRTCLTHCGANQWIFAAFGARRESFWEMPASCA